MNGVRVYVNATGPAATGRDIVFYSRRGGGPVYCWRYQGTLDRWRFARVNSSDMTFHELTAANWNTVPQQLQAQLGEHYIE